MGVLEYEEEQVEYGSQPVELVLCDDCTGSTAIEFTTSVREKHRREGRPLSRTANQEPLTRSSKLTRLALRDEENASVAYLSKGSFVGELHPEKRTGVVKDGVRLMWAKCTNM